MSDPKPDPKRVTAPPVPCAVWLTVKFTADVDNAARSRFADRVAGFLTGTGIRSVVSTYLIGLHHRAGVIPIEMSLITAWVSAQPEVQALAFLPPIPTLFRNGVRHG